MHSKTYIQIMNSKEWRTARNTKRAANPICERCWELYRKVVPTQCIHHLIPIESHRTTKEMWDAALRQSNLQSLCFQCHHEVHSKERYNSRDAHQQRVNDRTKQWMEQMKAKAGGPPDPLFIRKDDPPPNPPDLTGDKRDDFESSVFLTPNENNGRNGATPSNATEHQ